MAQEPGNEDVNPTPMFQMSNAVGGASWGEDADCMLR